MESLPERKHPRLKDFDYSHGWYFVTICTAGKERILGRVCVGRGDHTPPCVELSATGRVVEKYIHGINAAYQNAITDKYVIMPNHVHLIVAIEPAAGGGVWSPRPTNLMTVIRSFKTMVTKELGYSIWQTSYYDHVIRSEADYLRIWQYIDENPACWAEDEYYSK